MVNAVFHLAEAAQILTSNTAIPIGVCVAVGVFVVGAVVKANNKLNRLENSITSLTSGMAETWSRKDQEIYSLKLQMHNPSLKVPDVQAVGVKPDPKN